MKILFLVFTLLLSLPGLGQEDDEEAIKELESDRLKTSQVAIEMNRSREQIENTTIGLAEQIKQMGHEQIDAAALFDGKVRALVQKTLKESALRHQSPELIRAMIMGNVKGKSLEDLFKKFPVLLDIAVDVVRDRDALPALVQLFARKEKLKSYGFYWLALFILGFILRKKLVSDEWSFLTKIFAKTLLSLSLTATSLFIFYQMFTPEVGPLFSIIQRHLF